MSSKKKERVSNVSNASNVSNVSDISDFGDKSQNCTPFVSPNSSPQLESHKVNFNIPLIDDENKQTTNIKVDNDTINNTNNETEVDTLNDIDEELDNIVLNLKILSKLKENYKLNVNGKNLSINNSYIPSITRYLNDDSREGTILFLESLDKLIKNKIEKIVEENSDSNMFLTSKENILLQISHNLTISLVGLNNLIKTYSSDELTTSKIEIIINNFDLKIKKISNILKLNK